MGGILWADAPYGIFTFVLLTLVLGGLGAWATGRAMAQTWRPVAMLALYMVFLTRAYGSSTMRSTASRCYRQFSL